MSPSAPKRPCWCGQLLPCAKHPIKTYRDTKTDEERKFYSSRQWTEASRRHRRQEPLCRECLKQGITRLAQMTDHIQPISEKGARLDESNLQSLCNRCHNQKRQREKAIH